MVDVWKFPKDSMRGPTPVQGAEQKGCPPENIPLSVAAIILGRKFTSCCSVWPSMLNCSSHSRVLMAAVACAALLAPPVLEATAAVNGWWQPGKATPAEPPGFVGNLNHVTQHEAWFN